MRKHFPDEFQNVTIESFDRKSSKYRQSLKKIIINMDHN